MAYQFAREDEQLVLDVEGWTPQNLIVWLDRQLRQPGIHQSQLIAWITNCVAHLIGARKLHIAALMRAKIILARKLKDRIAAARLAEQERVDQQYLFAPEARVEVSFETGFTFHAGMYRDVKMHPSGRWKPRKHFLAPERVREFDGVLNGVEFQCAQAIDSLPAVRFWLLNVACHPESFWLPTATDKFYPDFVARLNDDRLMVIEYKGALLAGGGVDDTNEKRAIGRLWEKMSGKKGLFVVVEKQIDGKDMRSQLLDKLGP
nr:hypothetical protein [uncultured Rhodopila sp.]